MGGMIPPGLTEGTRVLLDTPVLIYHLEDHPRYGTAAESILRAIEEGRLQAVMSTLVLTELLVPLHAAGQTERAEELKRRLCAFPNLSVMMMTAEIASAAARLRALHGLRTPDAIHAATALEASAEVIITNDRDFLRLQGEKLHVWLFDG